MSIIRNSFGGLTKEYYFRNIFIGSLFGICAWLLIDVLEKGSDNPKEFTTIITIKALIVLNSLLYPYSKFMYDSIWGIVLGDRVYAHSINPISIVFILIMRYLCWAFAILLAPLGLIVIYLKNR